MDRNEVFEILIQEIVVNPNQPRRYFDEASISELAESIKQHGLIQPIVVRLTQDQNYELIAGERRLKAFKSLGLDRIPAIIKEMDLRKSAILALIENIQREDLHFVEVAKGYSHLMNEFSMTQSDLAMSLGKGQSTIANKLRLLTLPEETLQFIIDSQLTERHGRALLVIKDEELQYKAAQHIAAKKLSVKKTEDYIKKLLEKKEEVKKKPNIVKAYLKDIRLFTNSIRQSVDMVNKAGVNAKYSIEEQEDKYTITIDIPMNKGE